MQVRKPVRSREKEADRKSAERAARRAEKAAARPPRVPKEKVLQVKLKLGRGPRLRGSPKGKAEKLAPDEETVALAIDTVASKHRRVVTQAMLHKLVVEEIARKRSGNGKGKDGRVRLSQERVRKVGLRRKLVKAVMTYRRGRGAQQLTECPVCSGELKTTVTRTLDDGGKDLVEYRCPECTFRTSGRERSVHKYVFRRRL